MPHPQIAVTRDPTEEHTVVRLIGVGDYGKWASEQLTIQNVPYVETMDCDVLNDDVRAFVDGVHLLFLVFDPDEADRLNAAVEIATLAAGMPDMVTVAIGALPTAWQGKLGALLTLPGEESGKYLLLVVGGLAAILRQEGYVGVDYMAVREIFSPRTVCSIGIGSAQGADRGPSAVHEALQQMAGLGCAMGDATGAIVILSAAKGSLRLAESKTTMSFIRSLADPSCLMIYGNYYDTAVGDALRVTVIASRASKTTGAPD